MEGKGAPVVKKAANWVGVTGVYWEERGREERMLREE